MADVTTMLCVTTQRAAIAASVERGILAMEHTVKVHILSLSSYLTCSGVPIFFTPPYISPFPSLGRYVCKKVYEVQMYMCAYNFIIQ